MTLNVLVLVVYDGYHYIIRHCNGKKKTNMFLHFPTKAIIKAKEKAHLYNPSNRWASLRSTVNRINRYKRTLAETKTVEDGKKGLIPQNVYVRASSNGSVQFVDGPPNWMSSNREVINFWKTILVIVLAWGGRVCGAYYFFFQETGWAFNERFQGQWVHARAYFLCGLYKVHSLLNVLQWNIRKWVDTKSIYLDCMVWKR